MCTLYCIIFNLINSLNYLFMMCLAYHDLIESLFGMGQLVSLALFSQVPGLVELLGQISADLVQRCV